MTNIQVFMDAIYDHPAVPHIGCFHLLESKLMSSSHLDEDEKLILHKFPSFLEEIHQNKQYSEALKAYWVIRAEIMKTPLRAPSHLLPPSHLLQERHRKKGELLSQMIEIMSITLLIHAISPGEIFPNKAH